MKIYTTLQMGAYHINHCEDYLFFDTSFNNKIICAVMDGCTMGKDSYLIATIVGKLLRKICKAISYKEFYARDSAGLSLDDLLKSILHELFKEIRAVKNQLQLEREELLTTLIILLTDMKEDKGLVLIVGDGVVSINGTIISFDQDNKPDYLGFHLTEDFDTWYLLQQQKISIDSLNDISIATDGIESFTRVAAPENSETIDPVHFLLHDSTGIGNEEMLNMKLKTIEHKYGLNHTDDLAVIRLVK
ncbi:protein phosphatase 2C domain-containing protein [Chitinophaga sp. 22321]|uniref:Protein phosphatase 2C domain-containing protein n=1 Tax=Chitinophaga hostae TaxID=2831022 RepID=A0ABS5J7U7_9BACT|nr:protein phosphatase 2C domain-containing protein [Chitinophaga hostae]MBS0031260.1 protein phosphatase 2C domain-containing protein [Chitinophaga hostae]